MANIGHLSKPVTKNNWYTETKTHLFSHKTMEREAQLVDAFQEDGWSTGKSKTRAFLPTHLNCDYSDE
jgi:hypothetical protein